VHGGQQDHEAHYQAQQRAFHRGNLLSSLSGVSTGTHVDTPDASRTNAVRRREVRRFTRRGSRKWWDLAGQRRTTLSLSHGTRSVKHFLLPFLLPVLQPVELLTRDIHTGRDLSNTFFCRFCGECGVGTLQTRGWVTIRRNPLKIRKVGGRAGRRFLVRLASPRTRRSPPPMPAGSVRPVRAVRLLPCSASGSRNQKNGTRANTRVPSTLSW
jgi:hypothetical protein